MSSVHREQRRHLLAAHRIIHTSLQDQAPAYSSTPQTAETETETETTPEVGMETQYAELKYIHIENAP